MTSLKRIFAAVLLTVGVATAASAQFSIGPRVGFNVNKLHFSDVSSNFSSENRAGFVGGLEAELMIPVTNIGIDASVLYVHRTNNAMSTAANPNGVADLSTKKDYIEIPINLKWKIGLPVVGQYVSPYIFTGPSFAFLTGKKEITEAYEQKSMDIAWNVGLGLQLFKKLQIGASYGIGLSNTLKKVGVADNAQDLGKSRCWTITAAYLFSL